MNLKWFSKNIKAVFAKEEEKEGGGGKATLKQQLVKKGESCSDSLFSLTLIVCHGVWMPPELLQFTKVYRHPCCLLLVKIM